MRHPKLEEFIRRFNEQAFFEAHEVLEELWLVTQGEQKLFYQGLIQCAVSLAHWKRSNMRGANQVAARSFSILEKYGAERDRICIQELISDCAQFLSGSRKQFPTIKTTTD
jgi:predicted metal-dependent hydrolase